MDSDKTTNKAELAYEQIKEKILTLEFLPGQPLREVELSEQLSMSRTPVRTAVAQLISDGFVEEIGPKTNIVANVSAEAFMSIYQVRDALEALCVTLASFSWKDAADIQQLKECLQNQIRLAHQETIDSRSFLYEDREFHQKLAQLSQNPLLGQEMLRVYELYWRYNFYSLHANRAFQIVQEHREILEAIEQRDSQRAQISMRTHLSNTKDGILMGLIKGFDPARELSKPKDGYVLDAADKEKEQE